MSRDRLRIVATPIAKAIVVEGEKREARYFDQAILNRADTAAWTIHSSSGGDAKSVLGKVTEIVRDVDQIFVVVDGDRMPPSCSESEGRVWKKLEKLCGDSEGKVRLIVSHPCVEVWFLLHFTDSLPDTPSAQAGVYKALCSPFKDRLRTLYPQIDAKPVEDWKNLSPMLGTACSRCRQRRTAINPLEQLSDVDLLMKELGFGY